MHLNAVKRGRLAEDLAVSFLRLRGYDILERNFRFSRYEIDVVARRGRVTALVEVKFRGARTRGGAVSALTREKKRFLEAAAVGYLRTHPDPNLRLRFDVVVIDQEPAAGRLILRHIPGAFRAGPGYR